MVDWWWGARHESMMAHIRVGGELHGGQCVGGSGRDLWPGNGLRGGR